ncbi:MAG: ABC transporter substrate-binding protein [Treponema sp.]|nr:ABC transporter substrate-binding protein [Treponema sp.]
MKRLISLLFVLLISAGMVMAQNSVSAYASCDETLAKALFDQFEKETGTKVNWVRLSGGEAIARMEAEKANPQASIWVGGVGLDHVTGKSKDLTTPYQSRFAANVPANFKDPQFYWIGLYIGPLTFVTNLDRAKALNLKPPTSWADLIKPEYKGYIRMPDPNTSGTAYNLLTTIRTLNGGDENKAFDYLKKLDANIDQYTRSGAAPGQSVATGEIPIGIGYAHDQVKLKAAGANTQITAPSEGTGFELAAMSLVKGGKQPIQARQLYDWIVSSPNSQNIFSNYYVLLVQKGAKIHPQALKLDQVKTITEDFAWEGDAANRKRLLDRWNSIVKR